MDLYRIIVTGNYNTDMVIAQSLSTDIDPTLIG